MAIDYQSILAKLERQATAPKVQEVTPDVINAEAAKMAARGYEFNDASLGLLERYLRNTAAGIFLVGNVGIGKTFFFKCRGVLVLPMQTVAEHSLDELTKALESHREEELLVDDLGTEDPVNNFGVKVAALPLIIESRLQSPARTHFTTNLSLDALKEKYGLRVCDRINELACHYKMEGKSRRNANSGTRITDAEDFYTPRLWKKCSQMCFGYDEASHKCVKGVRKEPRSPECCPHFPH